MADIEIKRIESDDVLSWDAYVQANEQASLYHLSGWKDVVEKTYGHKAYYLMAVKHSQKIVTPTVESGRTSYRYKADLSGESGTVVGILPLVHLKHFLFGDSLLSIPFYDFCGILSNNREAESALLNEAIKLAGELGVKTIEIRNTQSIHWPEKFDWIKTNHPIEFYTKTNKVRMLFELPKSSEALMKSFKSKLRSQIKKPLKQGITAKIGSLELLDDFYKVFSINMRDLGSPVHSKKLMECVLKEFPEKSKIVMVYKELKPLACSLIVGFKDTIENPWASSLRGYSRFAPNMLLYWTMLEYACDNGFKYFDFGRSSADEGTYKFKKQWGARPETLYWNYISLDGKPMDTGISEKSNFELATQVWKKLPVWVTKIIGPRTRKYIGL